MPRVSDDLAAQVGALRRREGLVFVGLGLASLALALGLLCAGVTVPAHTPADRNGRLVVMAMALGLGGGGAWMLAWFWWRGRALWRLLARGPELIRVELVAIRRRNLHTFGLRFHQRRGPVLGLAVPNREVAERLWTLLRRDYPAARFDGA